MKTLTSELLAEAYSLTNIAPWMFLFDIHATDTDLFYLTSNNEAVTFDGHTYQPFPIVISDFNQDNEGNLPSLTVTVSNVSREVEAYVESGAILDRTVYIRVVHADHLDDASHQIIDRFIVTECSSTVESISFTLGLPNLFEISFPRQRYIRGRCRHKYKSLQCGYAGSIAACDKTLDGVNGCRVHGDDEINRGLARLHPLRYGGFPGIPKRGANL